ncbi:HAD hydrolase family protein [Paratractidigestivibacter sp.]|uniref:HAD hydrolase family protein n=1 Tax=Paratractidigestivibacter sp. TaxID=2847316 RepID=UPI002ABE9C4E|nr:HAD hydrolase family protein [Paratractidigestivibacter sp.]
MRPDAQTTAAKTATVFFDIDGTLGWVDPTCEEGRPRWEQGLSPAPNDAVVDAVRRLVRRGHRAFVCTGRPPGAIHPLITAMPFSGFITLAGAYVTLGSRILRNEPIDPELLRAVDDVLARRGEGARLEGLRVVTELRGGTQGDSANSAPDINEALRRQPDGRVYKVILPTAAADEIMAEPRLAESLSAHALELGNSEIGLASNTKRAGLLAIAKVLRDGMGPTYGFGDAENDLPILDEMTVAVAMGNAVDAVRERADYVTSDVAHDGVVAGLEHFGLI